MNNTDLTPLVNRLSRIIGQLESIKKDMVKGETKHCAQVLQQIKASDKAIKKFAEAYITLHLQDCLQKKSTKKELELNIKEALSAAFNM